METLEQRYGLSFATEIREAQPKGMAIFIYNDFIKSFNACGVKLRENQKKCLEKDCEHFVNTIFDEYIGTTFPDIFTYPKDNDEA